MLLLPFRNLALAELHFHTYYEQFADYLNIPLLSHDNNMQKD